MSDERLRKLERKAKADPEDTAALVEYWLACLQAGKLPPPTNEFTLSNVLVYSRRWELPIQMKNYKGSVFLLTLNDLQRNWERVLWYKPGGSEIRFKEMENIVAPTQDDLKRCFKDMLTYWLRYNGR